MTRPTKKEGLERKKNPTYLWVLSSFPCRPLRQVLLVLLSLRVREIVSLVRVDRQAQPALVAPQVVSHEVGILAQVDGLQGQPPQPLPPAHVRLARASDPGRARLAPRVRHLDPRSSPSPFPPPPLRRRAGARLSPPGLWPLCAAGKFLGGSQPRDAGAPRADTETRRRKRKRTRDGEWDAEPVPRSTDAMDLRPLKSGV